MLVPLYGFLSGDTLGVLVLMQDHETVGELGARLVQAAAPRVAPRGRVDVFHRGHKLDPALTVAQAGLSALERIDAMEPAAP